MVKITCLDPNDPDANFNYCPSFSAAVFFAIVFGFVTITHLIQAITYKKPYAWVLIMGATWETVGYCLRSYVVTNQRNSAVAFPSFILIVLAPLWINAFVYMVLGRVVHFFCQDDKVFRIKAQRLTAIFVCLDITAFLTQAAGGSLTNNTNPIQLQETGFHIYMAGIGLQQLFIIIFLAAAIRVQHKLKMQDASGTDNPDGFFMAAGASGKSRKVLYTIYGALALISIRIIFRLIEFGGGATSKIAHTEWPSYVFDATVMLCALLLLNVMHPGRFIQGYRSDFEDVKEEKKARKAAKILEKKEKKEANKSAKMGRKAEKNEKKETKKSEKVEKKAAKQRVGDLKAQLK